MTSTRTLVTLFAAGRLLFGVGLLAKPEKLASGWIGEDGEREPVKVVLRGLGARDIALSAGALASLGDDDRLALWLGAAILGDLADAACIFIPPGSTLPENARWGTLVMGGGAAATGVALLRQVRR